MTEETNVETQELTKEQREELLKQREEEILKLQTTVKVFRQELQNYIDFLTGYPLASREVSISVTKIQEAKMWLGQELGRLGGEDLNAKRDEQEVAAYLSAKKVKETITK